MSEIYERLAEAVEIAYGHDYDEEAAKTLLCVLNGWSYDVVDKSDPPDPQHYDTARSIVNHHRRRAIEALVTGEHVDSVARMVFSYADIDEGPTPDDIADQILRYLAAHVAALMIGNAS